MITGIATGSDQCLENNIEMQIQNFKAEEIVDERVWINKTHDPMNFILVKKFDSNKIISCVRNPYDCHTSLFTMILSNSQCASILESPSQLQPEWSAYMEDSANSIAEFFDDIHNRISK